ncbi:MAG: hypothetical protein ABH815_01705 [Candidatus Omnitrophota bacterium]
MKWIKKFVFYIMIGLFVSGCAASTKTAVKSTPVSPAPEHLVVVEPVVEKEAVKEAPVVVKVSQVRETVLPARITYAQVTNLIDEFLDIKAADNISGQPHYIGTSENKLVTLEIIGENDNIAIASIKLIYPKDIESVNADLNNAMMLRFLKNVAPEIKDWPSNIQDIINRFYSLRLGEKKEENISSNNKNIKIVCDENEGAIIITAIYR